MSGLKWSVTVGMEVGSGMTRGDVRARGLRADDEAREAVGGQHVGRGRSRIPVRRPVNMAVDMVSGDGVDD
jgi:hypothetical protein